MDAPENHTAVHRCPCAECRLRPDGATAQQHQALNRLVAALDEKSRRLLVGLLARQQGRGGVSCLARITGLSRDTIRRGRRELALPDRAAGRVRRPGGGRRRLEKKMSRPAAGPGGSAPRRRGRRPGVRAALDA